MKHGSLFSGIGGFDLAAEWMGWENVFHCEINEFGQKLLNHYWPDAISYGNITETDFTVHRGKIDILTGGFPCQPYSAAGKRKGNEDDRHLWPEMFRAIREIQPRWIVGENVPGIITWSKGMVFDEVQLDLETAFKKNKKTIGGGYEVFPIVLPACSINAPHRRDRVWFVAHNIGSGIGSGLEKRNNRKNDGKESANDIKQNISSNELRVATNSNVSRFKECWPQWFTSGKFTQDYGLTSEPGIRRGDDGFSNRMDRLKGLGNAIVPQIALQIFKTIDEYEKMMSIKTQQ